MQTKHRGQEIGETKGKLLFKKKKKKLRYAKTRRTNKNASKDHKQKYQIQQLKARGKRTGEVTRGNTESGTLKRQKRHKKGIKSKRNHVPNHDINLSKVYVSWM